MGEAASGRNHFVGPGYALGYRLLSGAPVRDYTGSVTLDESPDGGTVVHWSISFRPSIPGSGPLVSFLTRRSVKRVLDVVDARTRPDQPSTLKTVCGRKSTEGSNPSSSAYGAGSRLSERVPAPVDQG